VRWVLGEQSAKQLRGERMDAVIFAGNNRRRPLGMAEVTVTFDNSDGALATPFAEVSVTRRVYRNGEGEYFLNRTQVRLKDVVDLLLGTGLGPNAAAIISQGQIDAILSAKPEARREVFEEVAGTSRYQARKREAQRRLEQTDANAIRVNDVLQELERQVPAIERQVRRAKRYRKLRQRVRDLEILSFVRKTADRRGERARLAAELGEEETHRTGASTQRAQLEAELSLVRYEEYQAALALDDCNSARNQAASAVQEIATGQAGAQAHVEESERRVEQLERDVDAASKEIADAEARVLALGTELAAARQRRDEALRAAEAAAEAERAGSIAWEKAYGSLRAIEDRRARGAALAAQSESEAHAAQSERDRLAEAVARFDEELARTRERTEAGRRRGAALESEARSLDAEFGRQTSALEHAKRARDDAQTQLDAARDELERRRSTALEAAARLEAFREMDAGGFGSGVAAVKAAQDRGLLGGIVGVVTDCLRVGGTHAAAIDAALGEHALDVVVRSSADARAAIAMLKAERAGRATFLPLDSVGETRARRAHEDRSQSAGYVGRALDLVKAKSEARAAIEYLLGDIIVVDSLETALAMASPETQTIVTLEGELVRGAAIAGGAEAGPLARRAGAESLAAELTALQALSEEAKAQFERARQTVTSAATEMERALAARVDAQLRQKDTAATLERVRGDLTALGQHIADVEKQRATSRRLLDEALVAAEELLRRAAGSTSDVGELERQRFAAAGESDRLQGELSELRERHRSLAAETAGLVERVAQIGDDVEEARAAVIARRKAHQEKVEAHAQARAKREACASQASGLGERRAEVDRELARVQAEGEALRAKRDELTARCRELEERLSEAQRQERERSLELERSRIRLAEIDAELAVLQETFSQNPATAPEMDDVGARYAGFEGEADAEIRSMRQELDRLGDVNLNALEDQAQLVERRDFLRKQLSDLAAARDSILKVIAEIDAESVRQFNAVFEKVSEAFSATFARLFNGGVGKIWLSESEDPLLAGVEIAAQPPGKKMQSLHALSGGERSLTAVALIFAILQVRPSPFYIFDEIDAALDEANIGRFGGILAELSSRAQIVIITHNKATMTLADRIYGVTMGEPGVSSVLSLALEQVGA